jgi:hypothetical protein
MQLRSDGNAYELSGMQTISLKLPKTLLRRREQVARERQQSKSAVVRKALEQFVNGTLATGRPLSALDLAGDFIGCVEGPPNLSTSPKYLEGYGK